MRFPRSSIALLVLAGLAAGLAVDASDSVATAKTAGAFAILFAAAAAVPFYLDRSARLRVPFSLEPITGTARIGRAFRGDPIAREEVVLLLDRIERGHVHPALPSRSRDEIAAVVAMPAAEFREYVAGRLGLLERER